MAETLRLRSRFIMNPVSVLSLSALLTASLIGCGSGNQIAPNSTTVSSPTATATPASPADNWEFLLTPASSEVVLANDIEAIVRLTPDKFVGTARIIAAAYPNAGPCYNIVDPIPLSGTIDAQGNLSVTSAAVRGQVLSFTGVLAPDRSSVSLGTYAFKGGCADGHSGLLTGVKFKPIAGVYAGTLTATNSSIAVSSDLTQLSANPDGFIGVKGTVSYTSSGCTEEFTITQSQLAGRFIQLYLSAKDGTTTSVYGNVNSEGSQIELADYDGGCNGVGGVGVLSLE
jgi:hypothetical protein